MSGALLEEKKRYWSVVGALSLHCVTVGRRGGHRVKNECTEGMEAVVCQSWICCITILKKKRNKKRGSCKYFFSVLLQICTILGELLLHFIMGAGGPQFLLWLVFSVDTCYYYYIL